MRRPVGGAADEIVQRDLDRGLGRVVRVHARGHRRQRAGDVLGRPALERRREVMDRRHHALARLAGHGGRGRRLAPADDAVLRLDADHHVVRLPDLDPRHDHRFLHREADRDRLDALDLHGFPTFSMWPHWVRQTRWVPSPACGRTQVYLSSATFINWPKSETSDFGWRVRAGARTKTRASPPPPRPSPPQAGGSRPSMPPQTTFSCRSCAIAFASSPSSPARISSVCSPSNGGGRRTEQAVSENLNGIPSIRKAPTVGCSTVSIMARAAVCGSSSASATELILAQGTPTALSLASQASARSCASAFSIRPMRSEEHTSELQSQSN